MSTNTTEISRITRVVPPRKYIGVTTFHMNDMGGAGIDLSDPIEARAAAHLAADLNEPSAFEVPASAVMEDKRRSCAIKLIGVLSSSFMGDRVRVADMIEANDLWFNIQSLILAAEMAKAEA